MAVQDKTTVTLRVAGQGASHSRMDIAVRDLGFAIDEPVARGGTNEGPTPTDTALAALAGCTNVIGHKCAHALGLDVARIDVEIACTFDRRGVTLTEEIAVPFVAVRQEVKVHGRLTGADLERLGAEVAKYCPLAKLFEQSGTNLETIWAPA